MSNESQIWFAARLIYESVREWGRSESPLFEDRILLIRAGDEEEARQKARMLGEASAERYKNPKNETVIWVLREVIDVAQLFDDTIGDGSEVYYSFLDEEELGWLRRSLEPHE